MLPVKWENVMKIGIEESDEELEKTLKKMAINECCTLVFTSGTVGLPKAVMLSHDNLTWAVQVVTENLEASVDSGVTLVSYLPLSHIAAQIVDVHLCLAVAGTVYFADKDALKGSLVKTLQEARPTHLIAVPRVWEKMHEMMTRLGKQSGLLKRTIATWAKRHGLQHNLDKMNGIRSDTVGYMISRSLIFNKVKQALGFDRCRIFVSGAAPLSVEIKKYFMSLDIVILEGYGMSENTGCHACSKNDAFCLDAGCIIFPGIQTKLHNARDDGEGEICMHGRSVFMGYLNDMEKTNESVDEDGWLHTGDLGRMRDGFLFVTGRLKELIITAGGENVPPVPIEENVKRELPCVSNAVLIGDKKKFLSVLLTLKTEVDPATGKPTDELTEEAKEWLKDNDCMASMVRELLQDQENSKKVFKIMQDGIDRANNHAVSNVQKIRKFAILPVDFSIHSGELGPTLKLQRRIISMRYQHILDNMYNS